MSLFAVIVAALALGYGVDLAIEYHDTDAWQEWLGYLLLGVPIGILATRD